MRGSKLAFRGLSVLLAVWDLGLEARGPRLWTKGFRLRGFGWGGGGVGRRVLNWGMSSCFYGICRDESCLHHTWNTF